MGEQLSGLLVVLVLLLLLLLLLQSSRLLFSLLSSLSFSSVLLVVAVVLGSTEPVPLPLEIVLPEAVSVLLLCALLSLEETGVAGVLIPLAEDEDTQFADEGVLRTVDDREEVDFCSRRE